MNGKASLHETSKSCRLPGTAKPPGHFDACNVTAAGGSSRSVLVGGAFFRGARTLRLEALPGGIEHLHTRRVKRVVQQPALGVRQAVGGERLVDLLNGKEAAPDSAGEERLPRLVRPADLQHRHGPLETLTAYAPACCPSSLAGPCFEAGSAPLSARIRRSSSPSITSFCSSLAATLPSASRCRLTISRARPIASSRRRVTSSSMRRCVRSLYALSVRPAIPCGPARKGERVRSLSATGPSDSLMPYSVTISRAISVACFRSLAAPVEMLPTTISSAARPPIRPASLSSSSSRDMRYR